MTSIDTSFQMQTMDILKEFLEATTIHGLYYISTCKSRIAKAGWMVVVALGFAASTFLIHSSFADWAESPVATTITPHSVDDLPFPNVTICPPKGLNGALKYDLMRLANVSLSAEEKEGLVQISARLFYDAGWKDLLKLIGEGNIANLYRGFQEVIPEKEKITVRVSNPNGTFESLYLGQKLTPHLRRQLAKTKFQFKIELDNIKKLMGNDSKLNLKFDVDRNVEGEVKVGTAYKSS